MRFWEDVMVDGVVYFFPFLNMGSVFFSKEHVAC